MAYYLGRRQYCTHHNVFSLSLSLSHTVTVSLPQTTSETTLQLKGMRLSKSWQNTNPPFSG